MRERKGESRGNGEGEANQHMSSPTTHTHAWIAKTILDALS